MQVEAVFSHTPPDANWLLLERATAREHQRHLHLVVSRCHTRSCPSPTVPRHWLTQVASYHSWSGGNKAEKLSEDFYSRQCGDHK